MVVRESSIDVRVWHRGPPPHIGWWNASTIYQHDTWRWWNGEAWSKRAHSHYSAHNAALCAMGLEDVAHQPVILWNDYWPEGARVPRIAP